MVLGRVFKDILAEECRKIGNNCSIGSSVCEISHPDYCISWNELLGIIKKHTSEDPSIIARKLIGDGLIIRISDDCFRSIFFDLLLRASDLRVRPNDRKMVLSSSYSVQSREAPSYSDRVILPRKEIRDGEKYHVISRKLYDTIAKLLPNDIVDVFIETISKYFCNRGSRGFDAYQAYSIYEALNKLDTSRGILIVAPTGYGKTEIFTVIVLIDLLRNFSSGWKYIFVYPRKMLEIDQMSRLVELIRILNQRLSGRKIRIYIRDGDTNDLKDKYNDARLGDHIRFRGIKCSDNGELFIVKTSTGPRVVCKSGDREEEYDFIIPFSDPSTMTKNADIIVTNLDTLFFASFTKRGHDIDVNDIIKTRLIVFDEIHEYDSVRLAQIHYWLKIFSALQEKLFGEKIVVPILSSATIPNPIKFASTLIGVDEKEIIDLRYDFMRRKYKDIKFSGHRVKIYLFIQTMPWVSWETYLSELSALILYLHKIYSVANRPYVPQSIFFVNNIREINRLKTITRQALSLGSPLDILCVRKVECSVEDSRMKRDHCRHYYEYLTPDNIKKEINERIQEDRKRANILDLLIEGLDVVFSKIPLSEREEIYNKLRSRELGVVYATTSLELGVDYPYVSIIVNAGFDKIESMIQRIGRGGRSSESLWTMLTIILARNNPLDYRLFSDTITREKIIREDVSSERKIYISKDLFPVKTNMLLKSILAYSIIHRKSPILYGGRTLNKHEVLKQTINEMINILKDTGFREFAIREARIVDENEYEEVKNGLIKLLEIVEQPNIARLMEELSVEYVSIENMIQNLYGLHSILSELKNNIEEKIQKHMRVEDPGLRKISRVAESTINTVKDYLNILLEYINVLEKIVPAQADDIIYYSRFIELSEIYEFVNNAIRRVDEIINLDERNHVERETVVAKLRTLLNTIMMYDSQKLWNDTRILIEKILSDITRPKYHVSFMPILKKLVELKKDIEKTLGRV